MPAPSSRQQAALIKSYKLLRHHGEAPSFLRHCAEVYQPETLEKAALTMLRTHRALSGTLQQWSAAPMYRVDVRFRCRVAARVARTQLYLQRGKLQAGNLLSDALVVIVIALAANVIYGSFVIIRVALQQHAFLDQFAAHLYEVTQAVGNADPNPLGVQDSGRAQSS